MNQKRLLTVATTFLVLAVAALYVAKRGSVTESPANQGQPSEGAPIIAESPTSNPLLRTQQDRIAGVRIVVHDEFHKPIKGARLFRAKPSLARMCRFTDEMLAESDATGVISAPYPNADSMVVARQGYISQVVREPGGSQERVVVLPKGSALQIYAHTRMGVPVEQAVIVATLGDPVESMVIDGYFAPGYDKTQAVVVGNTDARGVALLSGLGQGNAVIRSRKFGFALIDSPSSISLTSHHTAEVVLDPVFACVIRVNADVVDNYVCSMPPPTINRGIVSGDLAAAKSWLSQKFPSCIVFTTMVVQVDHPGECEVNMNLRKKGSHSVKCKLRAMTDIESAEIVDVSNKTDNEKLHPVRIRFTDPYQKDITSSMADNFYLRRAELYGEKMRRPTSPIDSIPVSHDGLVNIESGAYRIWSPNKYLERALASHEFEIPNTTTGSEIEIQVAIISKCAPVHVDVRDAAGNEVTVFGLRIMHDGASSFYQVTPDIKMRTWWLPVGVVTVVVDCEEHSQRERVVTVADTGSVEHPQVIKITPNK